MIPRDYQEWAIQSIFEWFENHNTGNPLVVMPTGTGKSLVFCEFIRRALYAFWNTRILLLTHDENLVSQNASTMNRVWPGAPLGMHAAGLRKRDTSYSIIFGMVKSVAATLHKNSSAFPPFDILIIDEAHAFSDKEASAYQTILKILSKHNPNIRVIGFTATPYRLGMGSLLEGGVFTDIAVDMSGIAPFAWFVEQGYLSPLITKKTIVEIDTDSIKQTAGEYSIKSNDAAIKPVLAQALDEIAQYSRDRKHILGYLPSIDMCELVKYGLELRGISSATYHSRNTKTENAQAMVGFKHGEFKALLSLSKLTTGFDFPELDFGFIFRATTSPGLWVQILGRFTRPAYGKANALVLDFAGNTRRLGPINDPRLPRRKGEKADGTAPVRVCNECGCYNHARATECDVCGHPFPVTVSINETADDAELMITALPSTTVEIPISYVSYAAYQKKGALNPCIRVTYFDNSTPPKSVDQYITPYHSGSVGNRGKAWYEGRTGVKLPATIDEAIAMLAETPKPKSIIVETSKQYPTVIQCKMN